jgi:Restriction endonuclease BglII
VPLPQYVLDSYEIYEWRHAFAIMEQDFPEEFQQLGDVLSRLRLKTSYIMKKGGNKSLIAKWIDKEFGKYGWVEKKFDTDYTVDGLVIPSPTHSIDCFKNRIALELEWNNKDPFYDRDLNNFRLLFDLRVVSVGIVLTRSDQLDELIRPLGRYASYGQSTTHMSKLLPKIEGGGGGGCPLIAIGITPRIYEEEPEYLPGVYQPDEQEEVVLDEE